MVLPKSEILLRLYCRLRQSPCTIDILEDWKHKNGYQFHNRSLYRYLNELTNNIAIIGESIEIYSNEKNKKTWKLVYEKNAKELTLFDINTFFLTKNFVPNSIIQNRKKSFNKIESLLFAQQSNSKFEANAEANQIAFGNTNFYDVSYSSAQQQKIEDLIWAIQNKRKLILTNLVKDSGVYAGFIQNGDYFYPLSLKLHRGVLQLIGYTEIKKGIYILSYDTLANFEITGETFNPKKYMPLVTDFFKTHFGITQNIDNKLYNIKLAFTAQTGLFVQQFFWHSTQQWSIDENGNYILTLHCGINRELIGWIFQWMSNVKVLQPKLLHTMVCDKYKECLALNADDKKINYNNSFEPKKVKR